MSEQESRFSSQEQRPESEQEEVQQREVGYQGREKPEWEEVVADPYGSYEEGYGGRQGGAQREKIQPRKMSNIPKSRVTLFIVVILLVVLAAFTIPIQIFTQIVPMLILLMLTTFITQIQAFAQVIPVLIICALIGIFLVRSRQRERKEEEIRIFEVDGTANLILHSQAGVIRVVPGRADRIEVRATKISRGRFIGPENIEIDYEQQGDMVTVKSRQRRSRMAWGGQERVDYLILLPEKSDVRIQQNAGAVEIEGIEGQINASMNAGPIQIKQVTLVGSSEITVNAGAVSFNGRLGMGGRNVIKSNVGAVNITLPADTAFALTTRYNVGLVNNQFGSNIVGEPPHAQLDLGSNIGAVNIWKR